MTAENPGVKRRLKKVRDSTPTNFCVSIRGEEELNGLEVDPILAGTLAGNGPVRPGSIAAGRLGEGSCGSDLQRLSFDGTHRRQTIDQAAVAGQSPRNAPGRSRRHAG